MNCVFCQIRDREIPKEFTYEDENVMVFPDIHPLKPVHLLIVAKKHIEDFLQLADALLLDKMKQVTQLMIKEHDLGDKGYKLVINGGGAQIINHLHIHLTGPVGEKIRN